LAAFLAAGFLAAGFFLLPFVAKHPRNCVAVKPCNLHSFFTVSKSSALLASRSFFFSSASVCSCFSMSAMRCCDIEI